MTDTKASAARAEIIESMLSAVAADAGAGALAALKPAATARFRALGAPMPRDEYWRYAGPQPFQKVAEPAAKQALESAEASPFAAQTPAVAAFVNGRFEPSLSSGLSDAGVEISVLSAADAPTWAGAALGKLEAEGQSPVARPLAALNGALATDGLAIRVAGKASRPVEIRHLGQTSGGVHLRHVIDLAAGASLTLFESGVGAAHFSSVIEAEIADGAELHHLRLQDDAAIEAVATHLFARLGSDSVLKSFTLSGARGDRVIRNEAMIWLTGDDGSAHVAGGAIGEGSAKIDNTVFLTHVGERCESRQVYKNVLAGRARGVFQGKILVKQSAQKTDGYQISQSVLLDEFASFNAKPELEIYADDVKCSHGSTTGAIDETALFYLRARGVPRRVAESLLVQAFVEDAIVEIADEALQDIVRQRAAALISALAG